LFPLRDENPSSTKPIITWSLIAVNAMVFILQSLSEVGDQWALLYGEIPIFVLSGQRLYTLITSVFLHGGILHLLGNMLYLFIFGDNVEDRFGHLQYLFLYLFFGIIGGLTHSAIAMMYGESEAIIPAIGASGAISGILGAYLIFFPNARIVSIVFLGFFIRLVRLPAIIFIGFWFILQFLYGVVGATTGVAYWAHIGGFLAGFLMAVIFRKFLGKRH